jgi:hypothetical protein
MVILGVILVLFAPILFVIGLIFPRLFAGRAAEKPSRWRGAGIGAVVLVAGVGMVIAFPKRDTTLIPAQQDTATIQSTPTKSPASLPDEQPITTPAGTKLPAMTLAGGVRATLKG